MSRSHNQSPTYPTTSPQTYAATPPPQSSVSRSPSVPARPYSAPTNPSPIPPNPLVDHQRYKERAVARSKKLIRFFGDDCPIDVPVSEIEQEGLKAILASKVPLSYFLYSLLEDYSCENLFFYLEVEHYETMAFPSSRHHLLAAQHIFDTYLSPSSQFEVNIEQKTRREIVANMKAGTSESLEGVFDGAKMHILQLMEGSWIRFTKSEVYTWMKKDIGLQPLYTEEGRAHAVDLLLRHLDKQASQLQTSQSSTSHRRHLLVKHMVKEYCRTMLQVEFEDTPGLSYAPTAAPVVVGSPGSSVGGLMMKGRGAGAASPPAGGLVGSPGRYGGKGQGQAQGQGHQRSGSSSGDEESPKGFFSKFTNKLTKPGNF
ncbi:regulator of G-protein signaling [Rhizophlyctis rosea]|nr:regulator of G-protein signaling [Rhizophlyctis rosea]